MKTKIRLARFSGNRYIDVELFESKKALRKKLKDKKVCGQYTPEPYTIYPKLKVGKKLGTIYLNKENLGTGVITHEVLHCVFDWSEKLHKGLESHEDQEKACWLQGDITRRIVVWLFKIKAW